MLLLNIEIELKSALQIGTKYLDCLPHFYSTSRAGRAQAATSSFERSDPMSFVGGANAEMRRMTSFVSCTTYMSGASVVLSNAQAIV